MCSDNNDALLAIFSGEFSVSDDAWTLDAVPCGGVLLRRKDYRQLERENGERPV